ncbi:MAG: DNA-directed RNA polymerase subunit omega [Deltaproteobacteria bacterium]|nr:DNA-directed RNA polymerase subunit omega [Deltaproteobacteria bacterium]
MARITVEDCLTKVPNRFILVNMVAKRVRQIREGSEYLVSSPKNEDVVVSLREVAAGKVFLKPENEIEEELSSMEKEPEIETETEPETEPEAEKDELTAED